MISGEKEIISFAFLSSEPAVLSDDANGSIAVTNINVIFPNGTVISALVPDIIITGKSVSPADLKRGAWIL